MTTHLTCFLLFLLHCKLAPFASLFPLLSFFFSLFLIRDCKTPLPTWGCLEQKGRSIKRPCSASKMQEDFAWSKGTILRSLCQFLLWITQYIHKQPPGPYTMWTSDNNCHKRSLSQFNLLSLVSWDLDIQWPPPEFTKAMSPSYKLCPYHKKPVELTQVYSRPRLGQLGKKLTVFLSKSLVI